MDKIGSTRILTNINGNVLRRYEYDPYGFSAEGDTATNNPYQYAGRERDLSGLYYYRARYYSPKHGRFISEDPIGLLGGANTYSYVLGNPVSFTDPLGLVTTTVDACVARYGAAACEVVPSGPKRAPPSLSGPAATIWCLLVGCQLNESADKPDPVPPIPDDPAECPGEGWEWRGAGAPGTGRGNWVNPATGGKLHPDFDHAPPKGPHWGFTDGEGNKWDYFPDGRGWQDGEKKWK